MALSVVLLGVKVPVPPAQIPVVVAPETVPESTVVGLFLQDNKSSPAFTAGALVKVTKRLSFT